MVALVVYLTSGSSADSSAAAARDNLLLSARQDIVVLNTLDYHSVDAGLEALGVGVDGHPARLAILGFVIVIFSFISSQ